MEYIYKPLKTTLKIIATFLIILFIFFTAIETSLYWTNYSPSYFSYNSSQVHKSCDFNVKYNMNNLGFREEDFDFSKPNKKTKIIMIGDPFLNFTKAIGAEVDKSGRGLGIRSNRYTMLVDDMKIIKLQEEKETGSCEISAAENFLKLV